MNERAWAPTYSTIGDETIVVARRGRDKLIHGPFETWQDAERWCSLKNEQEGLADGADDCDQPLIVDGAT